MPDWSVGKNEVPPNRAEHAKYGEIRTARQLWTLDYTNNDAWVCVDKNCRAQMIPCAWERPNEQGQFCNKDGVPYKKPPYFRAEPAHVQGCKASLPSGPRDRPTPEYHISPPADYPSHVILFSTQSLPSCNPKKQDGTAQDEGGADRRHAQSIRGIQEACEYYFDRPDQRWRWLRVDHCPGATYDECFVKLGTGKPKDVGRNWIFFDEIRFASWVDLDVEPLVLPLLSSVNNMTRRLVVPTTHWVPGYRWEFRKQLRAALGTSKAAYHEGRGERPWIFFFGCEERYDDIEFRAEIQSGIAVLTRTMPRTRWDYRPSAYFDMPTRRQNVRPELSPAHAREPPMEPPAVVGIFVDTLQPEPAIEKLEASMEEPQVADAMGQSDEAEMPISEILGRGDKPLKPIGEETEALPKALEQKSEARIADKPASVFKPDSMPTPVLEITVTEQAEGNQEMADLKANDNSPPIAKPPKQSAFTKTIRRFIARLIPWRGA